MHPLTESQEEFLTAKQNHYDKRTKNRSPSNSTQRVDCTAQQVTQAFPHCHAFAACQPHPERVERS